MLKTATWAEHVVHWQKSQFIVGQKREERQRQRHRAANLLLCGDPLDIHGDHDAGSISKTTREREGQPVVITQPAGIITSCMNFLQTGRMSFDRVAENIITCFECGVARKISWMSRRMSACNIVRQTHKPRQACTFS